MIETLLGLVPQYGLWVIFIVVFFGCLAVPLPAFFTVLAAGGFASVGDLTLSGVMLTVVLAFILGDAIAFAIGYRLGGPLLDHLKGSKRAAPLIHQSETLLTNRGGAAVFLSHTVLSPTCAYVTYLCGAGGLSYRRFATAAIPGVLIWCVFYVMIGYSFAANLEEVAAILSDFLGVLLAGFVFLFTLYLLMKRWKTFVSKARKQAKRRKPRQ
ncbi:MAG: DedA family protein [Pseudoruegeria sp.]